MPMENACSEFKSNARLDTMGQPPHPSQILTVREHENGKKKSSNKQIFQLL